MSSKKVKWPCWSNKLNFPSNRVEGGLRTKGLQKTSALKKPLISYVTVVRNNEKDIRRTIESVQSQTYPNIEHIILDGASTDDTLNIIQEYRDKIDYFASEPDEGLYDALNKVIPLCKGDLICVLNSDDWLSERSAEKVVELYQNQLGEVLICTSANVVCGNDESLKWVPSEVTAQSYFTVANCCHNAIYATRGAYVLSGPYDETYKIASDFKWIMSCYDKGVNFIYSSTVTVNYSLGGISGDRDAHLVECKMVIKDKFPFLSGRDVRLLNYKYYQWRDADFGKEFEQINLNEEMNVLYKKYAGKRDFILSLEERERDIKVASSFWLKQKHAVKGLLAKLPVVLTLILFLKKCFLKRKL